MNAATDWWYWSLNLFRSDVIAAPPLSRSQSHHAESVRAQPEQTLSGSSSGLDLATVQRPRGPGKSGSRWGVLPVAYQEPPFSGLLDRPFFLVLLVGALIRASD